MAFESNNFIVGRGAFNCEAPSYFAVHYYSTQDSIELLTSPDYFPDNAGQGTTGNVKTGDTINVFTTSGNASYNFRVGSLSPFFVIQLGADVPLKLTGNFNFSGADTTSFFLSFIRYPSSPEVNFQFISPDNITVNTTGVLTSTDTVPYPFRPNQAINIMLPSIIDPVLNSQRFVTLQLSIQTDGDMVISFITEGSFPPGNTYISDLPAGSTIQISGGSATYYGEDLVS